MTIFRWLGAAFIVAFLVAAAPGPRAANTEASLTPLAPPTEATRCGCAELVRREPVRIVVMLHNGSEGVQIPLLAPGHGTRFENSACLGTSCWAGYDHICWFYVVMLPDGSISEGCQTI
jgi:hypothetical protein